MNHDVHTLAGAYALDALDDAERADVERHLSGCDECRSDVDEFRATAARLGIASPAGVPPELRERVVAQIRQTRQHPPLPRDASGPNGWRIQSWTPLALAAATVVLAMLAGVLGVLGWQTDRRAGEATARIEQLSAVLTADDRVISTAETAGGGTVTAVTSAELDHVVVLARDLPPLPAEQDYQLWVIDPEVISSAGIVDVADGEAAHVADADIGAGIAVAISVEPAGGSEQPTTDPIWVVEPEPADG